jgi:hypothetical protein
MTMYTLRSLAPSGRIIAVQRLSAETDKETLLMAHDMVDGASAVARFDLWQAERHILGTAPTMKGKPRPVRGMRITAEGGQR